VGLGRRRCGWRRWSCRGCLAAEDFEHHRSAGGAGSLDRPAAVLHRFLDAVEDLLPGLAFDAVTFGHKWNQPAGRWRGLMGADCRGRQKPPSTRKTRLPGISKNPASGIGNGGLTEAFRLFQLGPNQNLVPAAWIDDC